IAIHLRHDDIGQQKIHRTRHSSAQIVECFGSGGHGQNPISTSLEEELSHRENLLVVFYTNTGLAWAHRRTSFFAGGYRSSATAFLSLAPSFMEAYAVRDATVLRACRDTS